MSVSVAYTTSLGLSYDLSGYTVNSVRIAGMGYVDRFYTEHYSDGVLIGTYCTYADNIDHGTEITLVYRW